MSDFSECLAEMREHYKSNIRNGKPARYKPSQRFSPLLAGADAKSLSAEQEEVVGGLKILSQSLNQDEASAIEGHITTAAQDLKDDDVSNEAQSDFKRKLEERRQQAKDKAIENVDKIFDEAEKIEAKYPGSGPVILSTLDLAGALTDLVVDKIVEYVGQIVDAVVEWVKKAWDSIRTTFESISDTIAGWFGATAVAPA